MARWWPTTYVEAKASGQRFYRSARPCRKGHLADRYVSTKQCTECHRAWLAAQDIERTRAKNREYQQRRRLDPGFREKEKQYQKDNAVLVNLKTAKRYGRRQAGFVEDVPLAYLFERDQGRCQLCGDELSMATKHPDRKAATQDHIIPLSKGGTHERRNLQLACFDCNRRKSNRYDGEQMRLVG